MPAWAEWIEMALAGLGLAALVLACMIAEFVWKDNAPMRRHRKRIRAAEKAEGHSTPAPGAGEQEEG